MQQVEVQTPEPGLAVAVEESAPAGFGRLAGDSEYHLAQLAQGAASWPVAVV